MVAAILPLAYIIGLLFTLKTHKHIYDMPDNEEEGEGGGHGTYGLRAMSVRTGYSGGLPLVSFCLLWISSFWLTFLPYRTVCALLNEHASCVCVCVCVCMCMCV
jgi:hypothetical protein